MVDEPGEAALAMNGGLQGGTVRANILLLLHIIPVDAESIFILFTDSRYNRKELVFSQVLESFCVYKFGYTRNRLFKSHTTFSFIGFDSRWYEEV